MWPGPQEWGEEGQREREGRKRQAEGLEKPNWAGVGRHVGLGAARGGQSG